jgi:Sel1 repeat
LEHAAEQGDPIAQAHLGLVFHLGRGVPQSYSSAVSWYEKAVENKNPMAQYNLALIYHNGLGVSVDEIRASYLFNLAAQQGVKEGPSTLKTPYLETTKLSVYDSNVKDARKQSSSATSRTKKFGGGLKDWLSLPSIIAVVMLFFHSDPGTRTWTAIALTVVLIGAYMLAYGILFERKSANVSKISLIVRSICLVFGQILAWAFAIMFITQHSI